MCEKGKIFIDTFHKIRVLSNFAGRARYATFPARRPPPMRTSREGCVPLNSKSKGGGI